MTSTVMSRLTLVSAMVAILAMPVVGYAQEAVITGTVTDATGGVLPGVTVTAVHEATGNTFVGVTNERGVFRIAARVGTFRMTLELTGFVTVTRSGLELLLGQTADLAFKMVVTGVEESVTVTGQAPLLELTQSNLGGNIDPRQMQELPVQGRDWTSLALLAPGNRTTAMSAQPVADRGDVRDFQLNMDGQQVTSELGPGGQPRFSRDAIAEFQFISNRFDATQGRSAGVQVNAITKSGSNKPSGSFAGSFRNGSWNAADPVLLLVVPYQSQEYATTFGGPIVRDKLHFFVNHEYDRQPRTTIANTGYTTFNVKLTGTSTVDLGGARLDYQLSPRQHLMFKGSLARSWSPFDNLTSAYASSSATTLNDTQDLLVQFSQVLSNRAVNQIQVGYAGYTYDQHNLTHWSNHWMAPLGITTGSPRITFKGFSIGGGQSLPWSWSQKVYSARDELTYSRSQHDLKIGGEYLYEMTVSDASTSGMGIIDAQGGSLPANIEALFPDPFNADTWNLNAISPLIRQYTVSVGNRHNFLNHPKIAGWIQDDWRVAKSLTLNVGLRYDLIWDAFANQVQVLPWIIGGRPQDKNNLQPRFGFAYQLNDRTVLRGGVGKYYGEPIAGAFTWTERFRDLIYIALPNDNTPDFATNPFHGPLPTYAEALQRVCDVNNVPGCLHRAGDELAPPAAYSLLNHSWQTSLGFQRQLGSDMSVEMDYAWNKASNEKAIDHNVNLTYNPATGINYPSSVVATRFNPAFADIGYYVMNGRSNYRGLQTTFTKRFGSWWQASANYLLSGLWNVDPPQPLSGYTEVPFAVAPDLGNDYGLAVTDQRHRVVFNGIWQPGRGFQASGLYFFGSGQRVTTSCGGDSRGIGAQSAAINQRLCSDGTVVPFNDFVMAPVHRVDIRLQQRVPLSGRAHIDATVELFNLFNHANFGSYTTNRANIKYGQPNASTNLAFAPRTLQLGFRLGF